LTPEPGRERIELQKNTMVWDEGFVEFSDSFCQGLREERVEVGEDEFGTRGNRGPTGGPDERHDFTKEEQEQHPGKGKFMIGSDYSRKETVRIVRFSRQRRGSVTNNSIQLVKIPEGEKGSLRVGRHKIKRLQRGRHLNLYFD